MSDHILKTIEELERELVEQEAAARDTKRLINRLLGRIQMPPRYSDSDVEARSGLALSIRSDQFYGQPLASCVREIFEMRRALNQGPATVNEIYASLVEGGFAFETKIEENAKRGLRISLAKNTALFHKLPNGKFGLLEWYPNAKKPKKDAASNGSSAATEEEEEESAEEESEAPE